MTHDFTLVTNVGAPLPSMFRFDPPTRPALRIGAVQCAWHPDPASHLEVLRAGIGLAAGHGATVVLLQELTLAPYFCHDPHVDRALDRYGEDVATGPTVAFAREMATTHGIAVQASLFERTADDRGFNTAVCVDAAGDLVSRTRKTHIPDSAYYHEDRYFEPGDTGCPISQVAGASFAFPTCWDQWFPELARTASMDGAEVIVYPTAIGSEPLAPDADTQPLWRQMIAANGLANATFMVAVNRIGTEGPLTFYGSSFVSDPYGRVMLEAPRDEPAVLVADLDLDQRRDWLTFGLLATRRPECYGRLVEAAPGVAARSTASVGA